LLSREYVLLENRRFRPTDVGRVVAKFLSNHFTQYVDYDFTAKLEDELDAVSRGEEDWVPLMRKFWSPFKDLVADKMETVSLDEAKANRVLGTDPASGRPVSVRLGRYGPFAQIGTKDDEDKPRFASLRPTQSLHTITLEQALDLFRLPRVLGAHPDGQEVSTAIGRFGPFVKHGKIYASLKAEDDPYTIELPRALQLLQEKAEAAANRVIASFDDGAIQVLNGRYGAYITDGAKNARIPKDREPKSLTRDECAALLEAAPMRPQRGRYGRGAKNEAATKGKRTAAARSEGDNTGNEPKSKPAARKTSAKKTATGKASAPRAATKSGATAKKTTGKKAAPTKRVARKAATKATEPA
jgi:DNA topoisomerase-1